MLTKLFNKLPSYKAAYPGTHATSALSRRYNRSNLEVMMLGEGENIRLPASDDFP